MSLTRANEIRKAPGKAHEHTCTLCEPAMAYPCGKRHTRKHMTMLNVWYLCPFARHEGEYKYREAQSGVVSFEPTPRVPA